MSKVLSFVAAGLVLTCQLTLGQGQSVLDVSGTWTFEVTMETAAGSPTVVLMQNNETVSGRYSSAAFGQLDLAGTLRGGILTLTLKTKATNSQREMDVIYTSTDVKANNIRGRVVIGQQEGTFVATRKK